QSYKRLRKQLDGIKAIKSINTSLGFLGLNSKKISDLLQRVPELEAEFDSLCKVPDQFNELFSTKGWIAHDHMNQKIANQAVKLAKAGKASEGEQILIDHCDEDYLDILLKCLWALPNAQPRLRLLELAREDYL